MRTYRLLAAAISLPLVAAACSKSKSDNKPGADSTARSAESAGANTAALWAMAPAQATAGVVIGDRTGEEVVAFLRALRSLIAARPSGTWALGKLSQELDEVPVDILDPSSWAAAGIDASKGLAVFLDTSGDAVLAILPAGDRAAFRKRFELTTETVDGKEFDRMGPAYCTVIRDRYACSEDRAILAAAEKGESGELAKQAAARPAAYRGDLEILGDMSRMGMDDFEDMRRSLAPVMQPSGMFAATVDLGHGAATGRVWVGGTLSGPAGEILAKEDPTSTLAPLTADAIQVLRLRVPMELLFRLGDLPPSLPLPGPEPVDMRKALLENMTGELMAHGHSGDAFGYQVTIPVKDPAAATPAVVALCKLAGTMQDKLPVTVEASGCRASLDLASLAAEEPMAASMLQGMKLSLSLMVKGNRIELISGTAGKASGSKPANLAGSPVTADLLTGAWHLAFWGLYFDPMAALPDTLATQIQALMTLGLSPDSDAGKGVDLARWILGHTYEAGGGVALRKDGIDVLIHVTTMAADKTDAQASHGRALGLLLDGKRAEYRQALNELASSQPSSLAGRHATQVVNGISVMSQFGALGMLGGLGSMRSADSAVEVEAEQLEAPAE